MKLPTCVACELPVLELEGQYEFFDSYFITADGPPASNAGAWHHKCLRQSSVGPAWQAARMRNYVEVRGFEQVAGPPGWVVIRDRQRGRLLAIGATGELVDFAIARGRPAREVDDGLIFSRVEEVFHLELDDASAIAEMQRTLEQTSVYPLSAVLAALGIADRVVDEVALEDAKFRFDKSLRSLWSRFNVSARLEYGIFIPRVLELFARPPVPAFAIAYLPARRVAHAARLELVEKNASTDDPKLKHAIEFGRGALKVEDSMVGEADRRLANVASAAGISLPPMPAPTELAGWLAKLTDVMRPYLTNSVLEAAWKAGVSARNVAVSAELVAQIAYLRCAAPDHADLSAQASQYARELEANAAALTAELEATGHPLVTRRAVSAEAYVGFVRDLEPTVAGYRQLNGLVVDIYKRLDAKLPQLDTPPRPRDHVIWHPKWSPRLTELGARKVKFAGGFPEEITIDADVLLEHWNELRTAAPLKRLHVHAPKGRAGEIVRSPNLATIEVLDLDQLGVTDEDVAALAANPHAANLRELHLGFNLLSESGIEMIAASPVFRRLEVVNLEPNSADPSDRQEYYDETNYEFVPTEFGKRLEAKYGPLRWLHRS